MLKAQRLLLTIVSIVFLALTLSLIVQNFSAEVPVQFLSWNLPQVSLGLLLAVVSLLMGGGILLRMWDQVLILSDQKKRASRELERKDVSKEEAEGKLKVLESKVQTLEKALSEALKSNQSR